MSDHVIECYLKTEDYCKRSNPKVKCPIFECDTQICAGDKFSCQRLAYFVSMEEDSFRLKKTIENIKHCELKQQHSFAKHRQNENKQRLRSKIKFG
jgi:hypothetical protein